MTAAAAKRLARLLRRDRVAGVTLMTVVASLVGAAVGLGGGPHALAPTLSSVGAWLTNRDKSTVTHVNGLSNRPDARVPLNAANGDPLQVVQDGSVILVQDLRTGVVSRIDPAQLTVAQSASYGSPGVLILAGDGAAYLVDPPTGLVQRIDPTQLKVVGTPITLPAPLGPAGIDPHGTLWVPTPSTGALVPVVNGVAGTPIPVAAPGDTLRLTIAGASPVVTDTTRGTMTVLSPSGGRSTVNLPTPTTGTSDLIAPPQTEGALVPLVAPGSQQLVVVDTSTGAPTAVTLTDVAGHQLSAPQVLGQRVYVPDDSTGRLIVYDVASGQLLQQIQVTGHPANLEVFVQDGMLWANDADGPDAVSVDPSGAEHHIGKYEAKLPGGPVVVPDTAASTAPVAGGPPGGDRGGGGNQGGGNRGNGNQGAGNGGGPGGSTTSPAPRPSAPAPQSPSPSPKSSAPPPVYQAPASVGETPQPGSILVTFTPATAGGPQNYTLTGAPGNATIDRASVPGTAPGPKGYTFTVSGLSCDQQYTFTVVANYPGGVTRSTTAGSKQRPCVAPKMPLNIGLNTGTQHQIGVSWDPPSSDGGGNVSYEVMANGGSWPTTATSFTVKNLANFKTYQVTVAAVNSAGQSQPPATMSKNLSAGPWGGTIYNDWSWPLNVRASWDTGSNSVYQFPPGGGQHVTVVCVRGGGSWSDPSPSHTPSGNTWFKVSSPVTGYIATGYVQTSGVWDC